MRGTVDILAAGFSGILDDEDAELLCAECGSPNLHPIEVRVLRGSDTTVIDASGSQVVPGGALDRGWRGACIQIEFRSEQCDHRTVLQTRFHKGDSALRFIAAGSAPAPTAVDFVTIWRD